MSSERTRGKTVKRKHITTAQIMERLDSIETLINRVWASLPQRFGGQCPNGQCGTCGKCLPVIGCGYGMSCPQFNPPGVFRP